MDNIIQHRQRCDRKRNKAARHNVIHVTRLVKSNIKRCLTSGNIDAMLKLLVVKYVLENKLQAKPALIRG